MEFAQTSRAITEKRGRFIFSCRLVAPRPAPRFPRPHRQVSPCTASYFLLSGQEKVTKEKATPAFGSGLRPDFPRSGTAPGAVTKGRPCPFVPRSASMPRVPLRSTSTQPPSCLVVLLCAARDAWKRLHRFPTYGCKHAGNNRSFL